MERGRGNLDKREVNVIEVIDLRGIGGGIYRVEVCRRRKGNEGIKGSSILKLDKIVVYV